MKQNLLIVCVFLWACSGGSVSKYTKSLAKHLESENKLDCPTHGFGERVRFNKMTYAFETPILTEAENSLPWIKNYNEREAFAKGKAKAFILPYTVTNTSPVASRDDNHWSLMTASGQEIYAMPYNAGLWAKANGRVAANDAGQLPAGQEVKAVRVYPVPASESFSGGAIKLRQWGTRKNQLGRKERYLIAQALVDMKAPVEGKPIKGLGAAGQ